MECIVSNCLNSSYNGKMIGNLCLSCHTFLTEELEYLNNTIGSSQARRNRISQIKSFLMEAEVQQVRDKWEK